MDILKRQVRMYALIAFTCSAIFVSGCRKKVDTPAIPANSEPMTSSARPEDKPLADFQIKLLDLAFEAAGSIPVHPFIKDRSKAQQEVVTACLLLDQPIRAVRYADGIENWRRGLCYAKASLYLASKGYEQAHIKPGLELAERIAALDHGQQWRSDRIKTVIAQTYLLLGQSAQAETYSTNLNLADDAELTETKTLMDCDHTFEEQLGILDEAAALTHFDLAKGLLGSYAVLYNRYYDDPEKRLIVIERIKAAWETMKLPVSLRMESLFRLIRFALERSEHSEALMLVNEAQQFLDTYQWPLENKISMVATVAQLRFQAGDEQKAVADVDAALSQYEKQADAIVDINRATAVRPLGEAYQLMGKTEAARDVYRIALEAGIANPNRMPRARDLSATCTSMAVVGVEPDVALWERIHNIVNGLDQH
jgi:tetratricopeptide (TPR) repeat protein